jgi:hypothetical protein
MSALAAAPALAQRSIACHFATECIEAEPCAATDYAFDIETEGMRATLLTPSGDIEARLGLTPEGATVLVGITSGGVHLLTLMDEAGTARYTAHLAGAGMALTYLGTCKEG